jgi:WD40 repeat protein
MSMKSNLQCGPFILTIGVSFAAVSIMAVVQGTILFRRDISKVLGPPDCSINRLILINDDRSALVCFTVVSPLEKVPHTHAVAIYDLSSEPPSPEFLCPELTPHRVAAPRSGSWIYIATDQGELFALDVEERPHSPIYLGRHDYTHVALLECSDDGSIVTAAGLNIAIAWHRETKQVLWRREDLQAYCGAFVSGGSRFVCGLENGEVLELDAATGETLRKLADHGRWVNELAVSPRGDYMATIDLDDRLIVTDLVRGEVVWSRMLRQFVSGMVPELTVRPVFSSNGQSLAVVDLVHRERIVFVRPSDGLVTHSRASRGLIVKGLAIAKNGTCYSWDYGATVAEWRPDTDTDIRRFAPVKSWAACANAATSSG